mmetsp:Transcript_15786/g.37625  ORF Transcript_15786/g.37625 Transcript_15786/m.37625 type:complete len:174 (-) Transcript_15786:37-558(-)
MTGKTLDARSINRLENLAAHLPPTSSLNSAVAPLRLMKHLMQDLERHNEAKTAAEQHKHATAAAETLRQLAYADDTSMARLWPQLFVFALPLLQAPRPVLRSEDTLRLMAKLQELLTAAGRTGVMTAKPPTDHSRTTLGVLSMTNVEEVVRQGLVDNLARAMVAEAAETVTTA